MTKFEAISKVKQSLVSVKPQVITPKGEFYEGFVRRLSDNLLNCIIDPVKVSVTSACAQDGDLSKYQNTKVWAVAKSGNNWLLTLESENEFALGFGGEPNNIMMHGFSSPDVLAEWNA